MSGLNEIIKTIDGACEERCAKVISQAEETGREIILKGEKEAQEQSEKLICDAELSLKREYDSAVSSIRSAQGRAVLSAKVDAINAVLAEALDRIDRLDTPEYFDLILNLFEKYSGEGDCVMHLSKRDIERMPLNFEQRLNSSAKHGGIKISSVAADIKNGFVLDFGETSENCSFEAIVQSRKEELMDKIAALLFEKAV